MILLMYFGAFGRGRWHTAGPGRWARASVALLFLAALLFAGGVEAMGIHHHDPTAPDSRCLVCRVAANYAGPIPVTVTGVPVDLPETRYVSPYRAEVLIDAPHLAVLRLRAPPTA